LIFTDPVPVNLPWAGVTNLFEVLGASMTQGQGSRVWVLLNEQRAVFHGPHPQRVTDKGAIKSVRDFLSNAGVTPELK
jgi:hypothetical protein